jgi:exosortase D (VPLPA-CTERM-specific)
MTTTFQRWNTPYPIWLTLAITLLALSTIFTTGLENLWFNWNNKEEYSHGVILPFISIFLIWQKKNEIAREKFVGSWLGLFIFSCGVIGCFAGNLSTLFPVMQYSLLIALCGLIIAITGVSAFRFFAMPMLILVLSVPLPNFIYKNLSFELQLLSSAIGVSFIRLFNIPVYLEGNVIDLGALKLQVVEACSGLRYLFPLMTLGFIAANFFNAPLWKRCFIFFSTIPITILMNSFRIGLIGVTVEWWGPAMAEGFLHDFEGWIVFMACTAILFAEMALFAHFSRPSKRLIDLLLIELPSKDVQPKEFVNNRHMPLSYILACTLALAVALAAYFAPSHEMKSVSRDTFATFPTVYGEWSGRREYMEQMYIDELKFDDYVSMRYTNPAGDFVDFYAAYYNSQSAGQSAHSPRSCIPAGGWEIKDLSRLSIPNYQHNNNEIALNRLQIQKGDAKLIVYYVFKQRHRYLTNEFLVKWYLFWDAVWLQRKDGALIRISFLAQDGVTTDVYDKKAFDFFKSAHTDLIRYIPD